MLECSPLMCRARSSTAEQRPFKPLVESSNLSALTLNPPRGGFLVESPQGGWYSNLSALTPILRLRRVFGLASHSVRGVFSKNLCALCGSVVKSSFQEYFKYIVAFITEQACYNPPQPHYASLRENRSTECLLPTFTSTRNIPCSMASPISRSWSSV